ncbi:MAG: 2OG-Fe(II) oxygenase [Thermoanaerobaculia bacterium]
MNASPQWADLLRTRGYAIVESALSPDDCAALCKRLEHYASEHPLPLIEHAAGERALRYSVIDGDSISRDLPDIQQLAEQWRDALGAATGLPYALLSNARVAVNVNINAPGGEYRWHYDRNPLTIVIYLNAVEGGSLEFYPRYRLYLGPRRHTRLQRLLDRVLLALRGWRSKVIVQPAPGRAVLMDGSRCLHSVSRVENGTRYALVFAYELPGTQFGASEGLDEYLYAGRGGGKDPNYV